MNFTFRAGSAIVTGGAGALGSSIVRALLREGVEVAVPVRPGSDRPGDEQGLRFLEAELTDEGSVARFVAEVERGPGGVSCLVNAAGGYGGGRLLEETAVADWELMLSTNLRTAFLSCRAVLPQMRARGYGRILNIAAMTALGSGARNAAYAVAKRGVLTLTEALAAELHGTGITVNAIAPGVLRTEANLAWLKDEDRTRAVPPDRIAGIALYLCSVEAGAVSGSTIRVP